MQTFADITAARNAIMDFRADHFSDVPEDMRERFRALSASPSPVDQIVGVGELIFANRDRVQPAALELAGGLIAFATPVAWHGLGEGRGDAIVLNLRKDLGEIKTAPAAPEPLMGYRIEAGAGEGPNPA